MVRGATVVRGPPGGPAPVTQRHIGARTLLRGAAWYQAGQLLPVLAALALVPRLVHGLGLERFGILSLAWMLIGYFNLFDLGVSGALTRLVAERLAARREHEVPAMVWTALTLTTALGLLGAALLAAIAPWLVRTALHVPEELRRETLGLTWVLAASLPVVTGTAALAGVLAAQQRFGVLNAIRIPMGVFTYAGPLLVLPWSASLLPVGLALAVVRVLGGLAHLAACLVGTPGLRSGVVIRRNLLGPIVSFGGWMSVTAVVAPLMVYFDRFLIGGMLSMAMVAYYTTPFDLTSRMVLLSLPVVNVLFPAFAASYDADRARAGRLFDWGVRAVAVLLFPAAFVLASFSQELLTLWLGASFAAHSAAVLKLLAIGLFVNGLAQVALALVQSSGRPDLGARLHLAEMPFYLLALWLLIRAHGIEGAAVAWLARVMVDALALFLLARGRLRSQTRGVGSAALGGGGALLILVVGALIPGLVARLCFAAAALALFALLAWRHVARPGMRALLEPGQASPTP